MNATRLVSVSSAGFFFCRVGLAVLLWGAFFFREKWLVAVVFLAMFFSFLLKVGRAPMIRLYDFTVGKIVPSKKVVLNEWAMRFAHGLGSGIGLVCVALLYGGMETAGWIATVLFASIKTISAFGFCPASKMYECISRGGCCSLSKAIAKKHD